MKKKFVLLLAVSLLCFVAGNSIAYEDLVAPVKCIETGARSVGGALPVNELDEDSTLFEDNFEGENLWEAYDYTTTPAKWHIDDWNAYGQLNSWWCGEERVVNGETIYGYNNAWLQYLETPSLDLSNADESTLELDFEMQYGSEDGVPQNEDYDGWDGGTVFYSMDGGTTWEVLPNPSVEYNATSLYSFGGTHDLGPGIAGWRGESDGWENCTYDLGDLAGESDVRFRFAFASDAGVNTEGHPEWFGFQIDEISVVDDNNDYLTNDADGTATPEEFTPLDQVGADVNFELQEDEYASPTHAWWCGPGHDLFSVLISPEVELIEGWRHFIQFQLYCDLPDSDGDEDNSLEDYYQLEISDDGGSHWERLAYDYGYNGSDEGWVLRDSMLNNEAASVPIEIPIAYAGSSVRFRFRIITDDNDDGGVGTGLYIDDFTVIANSGFDHDVGVEQVRIPFPVTQGELVPCWAEIRNYGNNEETFNAMWRLGTQPYPLLSGQTLASRDSIVVWMSADGEEEGWTPTQPGEFTITVQTLLGDDYADNNNSEEYPVTVQPVGTYEYGFDDRLPTRTTSAFQTGEGPATHFNTFDYDRGPFHSSLFIAEEVHVLWNGDLDEGETVDVRLHILDDSGDDAPGAEIFSEDYTVESGIINPEWHVIDLSGEDVVISGKAWVWFELLEEGDDPKPHIVFSPGDVYPDNHFGYDGTDLSAPSGDWMIRMVGTYEYGVDDDIQSSLPGSFALHAAYPNPFNPTTRLGFDLPQAASVRLAVFDVLGREVASLLSGSMQAGRHNVTFDGSGLASGLYFARLEADGHVFTEKIMLVK